MSPTQANFLTTILCIFIATTYAGTWLSFNQKGSGYNDLAPYIGTGDLKRLTEMCKEEYIKRSMITRQHRSSAEICAALLDLVAGR